MAKSIFNTQDFNPIISRIKSLEPDASKKWGKMNINQMVCHLADQLRMALGTIEYRDKSTFFSRTVIKFLAVHIINAPPEKVQTLHELDQKRGGTEPLEFENDKEVLLAMLNEIFALPKDFNYQAHGMFGPMTRNQWGKLIYKHLDHHLRQFSS
ncbi:MAG: DUF1569 domain-containing protein [Bacteroidia bacterium]